VVENVKGVLFEIEPPRPTVTTEVVTQSSHIMLSYNWGSQPIVLKIAESLKNAGFKIWLDVEQMHGSTLEAMADAVENASCVLICMSEKYKDSPNCRLEGEYTNKNKKLFIPLMMQQNYTPKGWLGIMLGSKLWFSFEDDTNWEKKMCSLIKELTAVGVFPHAQKQIHVHESIRPILVSTVIQATPPPSIPSPTIPLAQPKAVPSQLETMKHWTQGEVGTWLKDVDLEHLIPIFQQRHMKGASLVQLHRLLSSERLHKLAHETVKDMGIEIGDMLALFCQLQDFAK